MKAIILAAGRGSRMKKLTDDQPKCLLEINGKPLVKWQIAAIRQSKIEEIGIVTGYKREMLENLGLFEFHNNRWYETQMVYSLCCANKWLEQTSCIVSYSDIFYETSAISSLIESTEEIAITYDPNWQQLWEKRFADPLLDAETFRLNENGTLREIGRKPQKLIDIEGQFMGLLKFSPTGWNLFKNIWYGIPVKERTEIQMTQMLQEVVVKYNGIIKTIPYRPNWFEIDSESDLDLTKKTMHI